MTYLHVQELKKYFGVRELFSDVSFDIYERDHVGLVGVNGCGKSTLIRMLTGEEPIDGGQISFGKLVRVASLDQSPVWEKNETLLTAVLHCFDHLFRMEEQLNELADRLASGDVSDALIGRQAALQDRYEREGGMTFRSRARSTLLGLGFTEEELESKVENMSGGQMRKAALAKILLSDAALLLLDEPTTHLDLDGRRLLQEALQQYKGTILLVSHDIDFVRAVATSVIEITRDGIRQFPGGYDYYREKVEKLNVEKLKGAAVTSTNSSTVQPFNSSTSEAKVSSKELRRQRAEERAKYAPQMKELKKRVETAEKKLDELQKQLDEASAELFNPTPTTNFAEVNRTVRTLQFEIDRYTADWEEAATELERLQQEMEGA